MSYKHAVETYGTHWLRTRWSLLPCARRGNLTHAKMGSCFQVRAELPPLFSGLLGGSIYVTLARDAASCPGHLISDKPLTMQLTVTAASVMVSTALFSG